MPVTCQSRPDSARDGSTPAMGGGGPERRPVVAFGPELPSDTAWQWVGQDLADELSTHFRTVTFSGTDLPECDLLVIVKYQLPVEIVARAARTSAVLFCPIDNYGCAADLDADWELLRLCSRIVLHAPSLQPYFQSYAPVELLDHHVKYTAPPRKRFVSDGPILWTGWRSNVRPLAEWVNQHDLPGELRVLTNLDERLGTDPARYGFAPGRLVWIEPWSAERHRALLEASRAALDIKGTDFRQRHKPATKAMDVIASGVPLAMNAGSSSAAAVRELGFELATPEDTGRWLSREYWKQTVQLGRRIREQLSRRQVGLRLKRIIDEVLHERRAA